MRVVVAGGGIAGLSIAHAIRERAPDVRVTVLEHTARPGGNIRTELVEGYRCEWGPDGFLDNAPATLQLVSSLGLDTRLRPSQDAARRRFIYRNGRLHEVPTSPLAFLTSPLLSITGKARIFGEPFARRRPDADETIHEFAARRIGSEAASVMVDAMVSGVFAGNAHALSLRASFPRMWQLETEYGSLFRALLATRKRRTRNDAVGAPAGRLTSFDAGMEVLVEALASSLGSALRTSSPLTKLHKMHLARAGQSGTTAHYLADTPGDSIDADAVVLAGPSATASELVRPFDPSLAALLAGITSAPLAVVCLGYATAAAEADRGPLNGFGFLIPRGENVRILGALWETSIYSGRAPEGKTLVRVMIGGALDPSAVALDDDALLAAVRGDLAKTMGLRARPELVRIIRHRRGIPQYTVGHLDRLQQIDARLQAHPGLFLAGSSYRGVAINSCIAEAGGIADRVLAHLRPASVREERSA